MEQFSVILNTGIQYYELPDELTIDLSQNVMRALRFFEFQIRDKIYLDPVYYFPMKDKYLRRTDLISSGYMDPLSNEIAPEEVINNNMNWLDETQLLSVNRLNVTIGEEKKTGLEQLERQWLPIPLYEREVNGTSKTPINWCRIKLIPIEDKCTVHKRVYRMIIAIDTNENLMDDSTTPHFNGQPFKLYSLCGVSKDDLETLTPPQRKQMEMMTVPLKAYEFCDHNKHPWLSDYLQEILHSTNLLNFQQGQRMKYLMFYVYFITYLHRIGAIPDVKLYNDCGKAAIQTNLIIDVGNSRTFGLVAEDPIDTSFSKSSVLELCDLETGVLYAEPFDMRLCFKEEKFGFSAGDSQFRWPSIVRLGKEALRTIYNGEQDLLSNERFDTNHSSPKRFLWDKKPYEGQWKFVSEQDRIVGPDHTVFLDGLMQQFRSDGSFTPNPAEMGEKSSYSRCSLMTFCFIEILLQVRRQINSVKFRHKNGEEGIKREISRVIITCPTAMPRLEQVTMRKCMEDASVALKRFYAKTYEEPYVAEDDMNRIEIIPSVRDLMMNGDNIDMRRSWNYDEATCCQMVYMYSELRRNLGNVKEFFGLYGKRRNGEELASLTIASLDIGAGTSDIMICNYKNMGVSLKPQPLFWESFHVAGDDLVKRIITDVILESPQNEYQGASGIITAKLQEMRCGDISNLMHHFFGDTQAMGVVEKRMRKEFSTQVLVPIANKLLDLLQREQPDQILNYDDFFPQQRPAQSLMDFFAKQFGFRFEDLTVKFCRDYLNEIVRKVFEPSLRKWAAIFYNYRCDVVLMGGRPSSLRQMRNMLQRLYPVTPNRLVSMNDYRVGSWYPGSSDIGHFGDKKSMVAVGALIAYLAEAGKLPMFKLTTDDLKLKVTPTSEFVGLLNTHTGTIEKILTPLINTNSMNISAFPVALGCKQVDVAGYPARMQYMLDFDEDYIRQRAVDHLKKQMGLMPDATEENIKPDYIAEEIETFKFRVKKNSPLQFLFTREYFEDKEEVKIESITNSVSDEIPCRMFKMKPQSWAEDESSWLDTGKFIMHIGL